MNQYDSLLKTYADSGLRTVEDWTSLGRDITTNAKPRLDAVHRGITLPLFSRDQTQRRVRVRAPRQAPLAVPAAVSVAIAPPPPAASKTPAHPLVANLPDSAERN